MFSSKVLKTAAWFEAGLLALTLAGCARTSKGFGPKGSSDRAVVQPLERSRDLTGTTQSTPPENAHIESIPSPQPQATFNAVERFVKPGYGITELFKGKGPVVIIAPEFHSIGSADVQWTRVAEVSRAFPGTVLVQEGMPGNWSKAEEDAVARFTDSVSTSAVGPIDSSLEARYQQITGRAFEEPADFRASLQLGTALKDVLAGKGASNDIRILGMETPGSARINFISETAVFCLVPLGEIAGVVQSAGGIAKLSVASPLGTIRPIAILQALAKAADANYPGFPHFDLNRLEKFVSENGQTHRAVSMKNLDYIRNFGDKIVNWRQKYVFGRRTKLTADRIAAISRDPSVKVIYVTYGRGHTRSDVAKPLQSYLKDHGQSCIVTGVIDAETPMDQGRGWDTPR